MAIETDKKSAAASVPKATENVNAAEKNVDSSIKKGHIKIKVFRSFNNP